jgi:hypothetical protein
VDDPRDNTMRLIEREQDTPNGLTRFLLGHEDCPRGLEVMRDGELITVICHGCEASFSYVTIAAASEPTEVDLALEQMASEDGARPSAPSEPGGGDSGVADKVDAALVSEDGEPPIVKAVKQARRWDRSSEKSPDSAQEALPAGEPARLRPPGPLARRRRRRASATPLRWSARVGPTLAGGARSISRRRRPIVLTALALGGAYLLVALGTGGDPTSSDTGAPVGGPDLPLQADQEQVPPSAADTGSLADGARTLEEGSEGADAEPFTGPNGQYELTLPSGWTKETTQRGSVALSSADEQTAVLIRTNSGPDQGVGELADQAAQQLAQRAVGASVTRIPSRSEGELLAVAKVSRKGEVSTAYIAEAGGVQYLVIASRAVEASALARLEQRGVITSFRSRPAG